MDRLTEDHLTTARRNQDLARTLVAEHGRIEPSPITWSVVVAFYGAVHYVNAYLWESRRFSPTNHQERTRLVRSEPDLASATRAYRLLQRWAFDARYTPEFSMSLNDAHRALDQLDRIEHTIRSALLA